MITNSFWADEWFWVMFSPLIFFIFIFLFLFLLYLYFIILLFYYYYYCIIFLIITKEVLFS